jgi:hypothetical protein
MVQPGLTWNVKDSFVSYVEALDDGEAEALSPASRQEAGFHFPWDEAARLQDPVSFSGALQFLGAVRFAGHWGALDVELRDPRIELAGGLGTLLVRERGGLDSGKMLPFAGLEAGPSVEEADGYLLLELRAALTGHGRLLLGGQYAVGQPLSPLQVAFPARHGRP